MYPGVYSPWYLLQRCIPVCTHLDTCSSAVSRCVLILFYVEHKLGSESCSWTRNHSNINTVIIIIIIITIMLRVIISVSENSWSRLRWPLSSLLGLDESSNSQQIGLKHFRDLFDWITRWFASINAQLRWFYSLICVRILCWPFKLQSVNTTGR